VELRTILRARNVFSFNKQHFNDAKLSDAGTALLLYLER
jgi:hypothetical protein